MIKRRVVLALPAVSVAALSLRGAPDATASSTAARTAAHGARQSPIDIRRRLVRHRDDLPPLRFHYPTSTPVSVRYVRKDEPDTQGCSSRGVEETEEIDIEPGAAWVRLSGVRYDLLQFHFHTPSEHTVNGRHAPLEIHLVHSDAEGHKLVVSVLTFPGRRREVDRVLRKLPQECDEPVEVDDFDLTRLVPRDPSTLRYRGSLTTDPFTQGVQWFLTVPSTASPEGIQAFRRLFPDGDSRDTQALNGRRLLADGDWWAKAGRHR